MQNTGLEVYISAHNRGQPEETAEITINPSALCLLAPHQIKELGIHLSF